MNKHDIEGICRLAPMLAMLELCDEITDNIGLHLSNDIIRRAHLIREGDESVCENMLEVDSSRLRMLFSFMNLRTRLGDNESVSKTDTLILRALSAMCTCYMPDEIVDRVDSEFYDAVMDCPYLPPICENKPTNIRNFMHSSAMNIMDYAEPCKPNDGIDAPEPVMH